MGSKYEVGDTVYFMYYNFIDEKIVRSVSRGESGYCYRLNEDSINPFVLPEDSLFWSPGDLLGDLVDKLLIKQKGEL